MNALSGTRLHVLLVLFLGLAVYSDAFEVPFTFDDSMYIVDNPLIKDLGYIVYPGTGVAEHGYIEDIVKRYLVTRQAAYLSFWLNYKLGGYGVFGYHTVNVGIHILNALLVYALVLLTFRTPFMGRSRLGRRAEAVALLSGLLFVAHPACTESVTYISQRFGEMATMFYLLSLVSYVGFRLDVGGKAGRYGLYLASFASALLAMKSKEIAFTLPLAIAMYEFMFLDGPKKRRLVLLAPLLSTMLIIPAAYIGMQQGGIIETLDKSTRLMTDIPRSAYFFTELRVLVTYIRLFFFPINQNVDYDYPVYGSPFDIPVVLSLSLVVAVLALGLYALRRSRRSPELRLVSFGVFWFFLTLSVESGLMPISERIFEYRMYLPMAGAVVAFVMLLTHRALAGGGIASKALLAALLFAFAGFASAAHARNGVWSAGVWADAAGKSPGKARVFHNLGSEQMASDLAREAIDSYKRAVGLDSSLYISWRKLGDAYAKEGQMEKAIESYGKALSLKPNYAEAHNNLADVYRSLRMKDEAIKHYRASVMLNPRFLKARISLALLYTAERRFVDAAGQYEVIVSLEPEDPMAHFILGVLLAKAGDNPRAEEHFQRAGDLGLSSKDLPRPLK